MMSIGCFALKMFLAEIEGAKKQLFKYHSFMLTVVGLKFCS